MMAAGIGIEIVTAVQERDLAVQTRLLVVLGLLRHPLPGKPMAFEPMRSWFSVPPAIIVRTPATNS